MLASSDVLSGMSTIKHIEDINNIDIIKVFEKIADDRGTQQNPAIYLNPEEKYLSQNSSLTYHELNSLANQLAHYFLENVPNGATISLFIEQSAAAIITILACWKAGYPFLPLNPNPLDISDERLVRLLSGTNTKFIMTHSRYKDHSFLFTKAANESKRLFFDQEKQLFSNYSTHNPNITINLDSPAYIVCSSGTTGLPKKIRIPRRGLYSCVLGVHQVFNIQPSDQIMLFANLVFDAAILDIMMPLAYGAQAHIPPIEIRKDIIALSKFIKNQGINIAVLPPAILRLLEPNEDVKSLSRVISTGEKIDIETLKKWSFLQIVDGYGPAEARIATWLRKIKFNKLDPDHQISYELHIIPGLEVHILKPLKENEINVSVTEPKSVDVGEEGEIYITGTGLGEYIIGTGPDENLNRKLAEQRFPIIQDPKTHKPVRSFRTFDLAVKDSSGNIEIKGRIDKQRKIDGELFCPEEIETVLREADVNIQIAYVDIDETKDNQIRAYLKLKDYSKPLYLPALYEYIVNKLSMKMAPSVWCVLDKEENTLNSSYKLSNDYLKKFRQLEGYRIQSFNKEVPQDVIEICIEKKLLEYLNITNKNFKLNRDDNILYLGVKSLQCAAFLRALRDEFRYCNFRMTLPEFMEAPTIASVARVIRRLQNLPGSPTLNELSLFNTISSPEKNVPVILLPSLMGQPEEDYAKLREAWPYQRQLYLLYTRGRDSLLDIDNYPMAVARDDAKTIVKYFPDPDKPLFLAGWSLGGLRGLLLKNVLERTYGKKNVRLLMFDTEAASVRQKKSPSEFAAHLCKFFEEKLCRILKINLNECGINKAELEKLPNEHQVYRFFEVLNKAMPDHQSKINRYLIETIKNNFLYLLRYVEKASVRNVTLITAEKTREELISRNELAVQSEQAKRNAKAQGERLNHSNLIRFDEIIPVKGNHESIILGEGVKETAELLNKFCEKQEIEVNLDKIRKKLQDPIDIDHAELSYYIPARGSNESSDKEDFDLAQRMIEILKENRAKSILLLGPAAVGKSTFLQFLTTKLKDKLILYIKLSRFQNPAENLIEKHLVRLGLIPEEIQYVKQHCELVICCDDYEENDREKFRNLIASNRIFEWKATVIFGVRSSYILTKYSGTNYRSLFYPIVNGQINRELFKEMYIRLFTPAQMENYIKKFLENLPLYLQLEGEYKKPDIYIKYLDVIPGARRLCAIPFFLRLFIENLPTLLKRYQGKNLDEFAELTEYDLMEMASQAFYQRQFDKMAAAGMVLDIDYPRAMDAFSVKLSVEMYKKGVYEIAYQEAVQCIAEDHREWQEYFGVSNATLIKVREGCLIRQISAQNPEDGYIFSFIHPELRDHYYSKYLGRKPLKQNTIINRQAPPSVFAAQTTFFHKPQPPAFNSVPKLSMLPIQTKSSLNNTPVVHEELPNISPISNLDVLEQKQLEEALQLSLEEVMQSPSKLKNDENPDYTAKQLTLLDGRIIKIERIEKAKPEGNCGFRVILGGAYLQEGEESIIRKKVIDILLMQINKAQILDLIAVDILARYKEWISGDWPMEKDDKFPNDMKAQFKLFRDEDEQSKDKECQQQLIKRIEDYCKSAYIVKKYLNQYLIHHEIFPHLQGSLLAFAQIQQIKIYCIQGLANGKIEIVKDIVQDETIEFKKEIFLLLNSKRNHFDNLVVSITPAPVSQNISTIGYNKHGIHKPTVDETINKESPITEDIIRLRGPSN